MKRVPLSQGQFATVDDEDYPLVSEFRWCYRSNKDGTQGYAVRHHKVEGKDRLLYLHRQLMPTGKNQEAIFLNHDRLDCRKENLKVVSHEEARWHHRVRKDSKSGVKGVRYLPETDLWAAYVYRHGHCYPVGTYPTKEAASAAYEAELRKEAPGLHQAPQEVNRSDAEG